MKTIMRGIAAVLSVMMLMPAAYAADINGTEITTAPDDWVLNSSEITDGEMKLGFDTTSSAEKAKSEITTSAYDISGKAIVITFKSIASVNVNSDKVEQSISLIDDNAFNTNKLFSLKNGVMSVFGSAAEAECKEDTEHRITIAIDPTGTEVKGAAWLDNKPVYSGEYSAYKTTLDLSAVQIAIKNNASSSIADKSEWTLTEFEISCFDDNYSFAAVPQDGQKMISPGDIEGIDVSFGTRMADIMYCTDSYSLENQNGEVEFSVLRIGNNAKIIPQNGFEEMSDYTLTINKQIDVWNNEKATEKTISFTTSYEGYTAPNVTVQGETEISIFMGQEANILFEADKEIERMEIYADDIMVKEITAAPYSYNIFGEEADSFKVKAVAYDKEGGTGSSPEVAVQIKEHNPPVLSISGITDGAKYGISSLPVAEATASDDNGIKNMRLYIDGREVQWAYGEELSFNMEGISAGQHNIIFTAEDIYGLTSSAEYNIEIVSDSMVEGYTNDFEDYKGDNALPRDMAGGKQRGYLDAGVIDEEHGNSLLIGIDEADLSFGEGDTAYVGIPMGDATGRVIIDFEINISTYPSGKYSFATKRTGGAQTMVAFITASEIQLCSRNNVVAQTIPYQPGEWYKVHFEADVTTAEYIITVMDAEGKAYSQSGAMGTGYDILSHFRIFGPADDTVKSFVAVDNVFVELAMDFPVLTAETVDYGQKVVTITSSLPLKTDDISAETVTLSNEFSKIAVKEVASSDGKTIIIKTERELESNMEYKVELSPSIRHSVGAELGAVVEARFKTTAKGFEILSGSFDNGKFNFEAVNDGETKNAAVIVQKWTSDGFAKEANVVYLDINSGTGEYSIDIPQTGNGYITVYVWDGIVSPTPVSPKIWILK